MLNKFAKLLLVLTSLAPIALTIGVNRWSQHADWVSGTIFVGVGFVLVALCLGILSYAKHNGQTQRVHIASFERDNRSVIDFLVVYLLPLINTKDIGYDGDIVTSAFVVALIVIVFMHKGAFEFNPVLGLCGYHFYTVQIDDGFSSVLISCKELPRRKTELQTVELAPGLYLHKEQ